jgi:hypothetical protein
MDCLSREEKLFADIEKNSIVQTFSLCAAKQKRKN